MDDAFKSIFRQQSLRFEIGKLQGIGLRLGDVQWSNAEAALKFAVSPSLFECIWLSTGGSLGGQGDIVFKERADNSELTGRIGLLTYLEEFIFEGKKEGPFYSIELHLNTSAYRKLFDMCARGIRPSSVSLSIVSDYLTSASAPGHSKWDVSKALLIEGASLGFATTDSDGARDQEEKEQAVRELEQSKSERVLAHCEALNSKLNGVIFWLKLIAVILAIEGLRLLGHGL